MGGGRKNVKPTDYRNGQNIIKDNSTGAIVYMPPEAKDVPDLMKNMVTWIKEANELPTPILAAITHYQFATIHPYYDGNGRTARLLATLILHLGGYDLKGLYSLEEYYVKNLLSYYNAINVGPSHNYYYGRRESDITPWITYFLEGMVFSFEKVTEKMMDAQQKGEKDQIHIMRSLDPKQRKVLNVFREFSLVTSKQIGSVFGFRPRTSSALSKKWVEEGFLEIADRSLKGRKYRLAKKFEILL